MDIIFELIIKWNESNCNKQFELNWFCLMFLHPRYQRPYTFKTIKTIIAGELIKNTRKTIRNSFKITQTLKSNDKTTKKSKGFIVRIGVKRH